MPRLIASAWAVFTLSVKFLLRVVRLEGLFGGLFGGCSDGREEELPTGACGEGGQGEGTPTNKPVVARQSAQHVQDRHFLGAKLLRSWYDEAEGHLDWG